MGALCSSPPEPPPNPTHVDLTHFTLLKVVGAWTNTAGDSARAGNHRASSVRSRISLLISSCLFLLCVCLCSWLSLGKGGFGKVNAIQRRENNELMALKRMSKAEVIKKESHIRMVWTERDIMARLHSPFLVSLIHSFQDDKECYFCMPFMQGGDLRFHLSKLGCLDEDAGRFYSSEIILGLEAMHAINVVYRGQSNGGSVLRPADAVLFLAFCLAFDFFSSLTHRFSALCSSLCSAQISNPTTCCWTKTVICA